jgi:hypothetical protein
MALCSLSLERSGGVWGMLPRSMGPASKISHGPLVNPYFSLNPISRRTLHNLNAPIQDNYKHIRSWFKFSEPRTYDLPTTGLMARVGQTATG